MQFAKGYFWMNGQLKVVESPADSLFRLRVTQKALQLPLFSYFCYSLQQIWTD